MEIFWLSNNTESYASIYETNITLNTASSCHFINSYKTLIGFDKESKYLIEGEHLISMCDDIECIFTTNENYINE